MNSIEADNTVIAVKLEYVVPQNIIGCLGDGVSPLPGNNLGIVQ